MPKITKKRADAEQREKEFVTQLGYVLLNYLSTLTPEAQDRFLDNMDLSIDKVRREAGKGKA